MAQANVDLIEALRQIARQLETEPETAGFRPDKKTSFQLLAMGLTAADLEHLQNFSDPEVLEQLPNETNNQATFATSYLRAWANLLEDQLLAMLDLPVSIRHLQLAA